MKIALFGGTFNPPHMGHVHLARAVWQEVAPDRLILMPAGMPPHKALPAFSATAEQRYEMTLLAAEDIPYAEVSRMELERENASYTSDTLQALAELYPGAALILAVGSDMFFTLDQWHEAPVIFSLASIAAAPRDHGERAAMQQRAEAYARAFGASITILKSPVLPVSSSEIREAILRGGDARLLPEKVADYIKAKGLYRGQDEK